MKRYEGEQSFTIASTSGVNPVVLDLGAVLDPGVYTLTVTDNLVASDSGMALDGEMAGSMDPGSLPSGDGEPGGDAVITFVVSGASIPTMSEWGIVAMTLLVLTTGTIVLMKR